MDALIAEVGEIVKGKVLAWLSSCDLVEVASLTVIQEAMSEAGRAAAEAVGAAWREALVRLAQALRSCPRCGRSRKCKWRSSQPLRVAVLGFTVEVPKLYLECGHCDAPGLSVVKLLTGLGSGEASAQLKLAAAYCAAGKSYGDCRRDMAVHYGQDIERTKLRRLALEVEQAAMAFAEADRAAQLERIGGEARTVGVPLVLLEADGGKVRTGTLMPCEPGDAGFGQRTPKRDLPRRKRPVSWREVITMDAREPGATDATALDVLVPLGAPSGERTRRMLALAGRTGLRSNTRSIGLGDMGSELATSFGEAFFDYPGSFWCADWKHTCDYVTAALRTYLDNNWRHMRFAELKALGLPFVSARAEAQVRVRTKDRFSVAGAWRLQNVEPKATLRAIVADGRWTAFSNAFTERHRSQFERRLRARLAEATRNQRISAQQLTQLGLATTAEHHDIAA